MNRGEPTKWRAHFSQLISRPIPKTEFPKIAERMFNDGLFCDLTGDGAVWFSGRYRVSASEVRRMWSLSPNQWTRFMRWVYEEAPFHSLAERVNNGETIQVESGARSSGDMGPE